MMAPGGSSDIVWVHRQQPSRKLLDVTMPKITVRVPTSDPKAALAKVRPALEKTVSDFQGHDLELTGDETTLNFKFKSMAFTIAGRVLAEPTDVLVEVDLPFAALMFKDKAEKAIQKNITRAIEGSV
jgi:hypothetical protein